MTFSLQSRYIARTMAGLEELLEEELIEQGAKETQKLTRAVAFTGDAEAIYRIHYHCRCCLAVIYILGEWKVASEDELYRRVRDIAWEDYMLTEQTFAIRSTVHSQIFTHSHYVSLKSKDAVADRFRDLYGRRPDVDTDQPDIPIHVHIRGSVLTVGLDASGDSLFKRGYRQRAGIAPLNEVLAAGIVKLSGWQGENTLVDPMCGSGTLAIEAALYASGKSPHSRERTFAFQNWPNYDASLWLRIKRQKNEGKKDLQLHASDIDQNMLTIAMENARMAKVQSYISFETADFFKLEPPAGPCTLLMNPPYDIRLRSSDIGELYSRIGDRLKQAWTGSTAWIFTANLEAAKQIGLRTSRKITLYNGPNEGRLLRFDLY